MFHKTIVTADKSKLSFTEAQRAVRIILAMFAVNLLITIGIALKLTVVSWDIGLIDRNCQCLLDRSDDSPDGDEPIQGDSVWSLQGHPLDSLVPLHFH